MAEDRQFGFETLQLHAGYTPDATGSIVPPIYPTSSYVFEDTKHAADLFALAKPGNIYTRIMNPTTSVLEERINALEGGVGALATSSGHSAQLQAFLTILEKGDHIVASNRLYGGTHNQLQHTLPRLGIETTFVDPTDPAAFAAAIKPNTKLIYGETLGNPDITVFPFEEVSKIAKENKIPLMIDNTFATAYIARPLALGADIVVSSTTKFYGGHGTTIGGIIVDGGKFDWAASGKFKTMTEPDPSYHGLVWASIGAPAFILKARALILRDVGGCPSPFDSWILAHGVQTLSVRLERHRQNTEAVIDFLTKHNKVDWVSHPSVPGHPSHEAAKKYLPNGAGSIFGFGPKGGRAAAEKVINSFKLVTHLANVGDARTLAIHPASTTHSQLTDEELLKAGVKPDFIRFSVGIENIDDILWDLDQALAQI